MIWQLTVLMTVALCAFGDGYAISEQKIKIIHKEHNVEAPKESSKKPENHDDYASSYPSYEFSYKVHDPHSHDMKGQTESKNKGGVKGEYWLIEPNGHKRIVTYHADDHSGFHATVHYADVHHDYKKEEEGGNAEAGGEADAGGEAEAGGEEENAGNEGEGAQEEAAEGNEGGAEEESRDQPNKVGRWIHDRHWGHEAKASRSPIVVQSHPYPSSKSGVIVRENYHSSHY